MAEIGNDEHQSSLHKKESFLKACEILEKDCKSLSEQVKHFQDLLLDTRKGKKPDTLNGSAADNILLAKHQELTAHIKAIQDTESRKPPDNDIIHYELVMNELKKSIAELEDTLVLVKSESKELQSEIEKEEQFKVEVGQVSDVLQEKLLKAQEQQRSNDNSAMIQDMKRREVALNRTHNKLMKLMAEFVMKHFPEPTESQISKWRKTQRTSLDDCSIDEDELMPLISILQLLMNKCIDSPHDAYITVGANFWPPYTELLVRTGIAIRNPANQREIRLTPFHL